MVPITMQTILTLDLGHNNSFAKPPLPPTAPVEEDLIDVDLSRHFIFLDVEMDSDQESNSSGILLSSSSSKMEEEAPPLGSEVEMIEFD